MSSSQPQKFTKIEFEYCKEVTQKLYDHPLAVPFLRPVDPEQDYAPDYFIKIQHPMDLGTVMQKLEKGEYNNSKEWIADVQLIWSNARTYNQKKTILHTVAEILQNKFNKICKVLPKTEMQLWSLKISKANKKLKAFLEKPPPTDSIVPRLPELALQHEE